MRLPSVWCWCDHCKDAMCITLIGTIPFTRCSNLMKRATFTISILTTESLKRRRGLWIWVTAVTHAASPSSPHFSQMLVVKFSVMFHYRWRASRAFKLTETNDTHYKIPFFILLLLLLFFTKHTLAPWTEAPLYCELMLIYMRLKLHQICWLM